MGHDDLLVGEDGYHRTRRSSLRQRHPADGRSPATWLELYGCQSVTVHVTVKGDAPADKLRDLVNQSQGRSAVYDILTNQTPVTTWCAIEVGTCWPGGSADGWLPVGGAVRDQTGDGQVGLVVILVASDPALQGPPLLLFGVGVLDTDPFRGLLFAGFLPGHQLFG